MMREKGLIYFSSKPRGEGMKNKSVNFYFRLWLVTPVLDICLACP